jgi:BASS family bile acid:Na+ symporter
MSLSGIETLLMPVFMFLLMLGLGATLSADNFRQILRRPRPVLIGLASQYGWLPPIALGLALTLKLSPAIALGLIIMSCSAGGPISNFFAYISRADLALSISMTVVSTLCGVIMIPLLLLLYTTPFINAAGDSTLTIPLAKIIVTLIILLVPVGLGIFLRRQSPLWARRVATGGTIAGWSVIVLVITSTLLREGAALLQLAPGIYLAGLLLAPIGFLFGYLGARTLEMATAQRRAVSLETGIQNVPLALAIILLSFPAEVQTEILVVPILYGVAIVPLSALAVWLFRLERY